MGEVWKGRDRRDGVERARAEARGRDRDDSQW